MKVIELLLLLTFVLRFDAVGQQDQAIDQVTSHAFLQQLDRDGVYFFISSKVAESLLIHRVEPSFPHHDMEARVSGTVIIAFELSKNGAILHPMVVSGPALLRPPALAALRQWKCKPYVLRGEPVTVATSIPITMSNY
jgi:outer membrane biosynthesis protein TonB